MKDYVHCNNCGWIGLVKCGEDKCPNCNYIGALGWEDMNNQEVPNNFEVRR